MRLLYFIFVFALIAAVVAPFYLKGPDGMPLMTVDKFVDDNTPEALVTPTEVYRWQDADGVWQFGDEPPATAGAQAVEIRPNITPIKADWVAQLEAQEAEKAAASGTSTVIGPPADTPIVPTNSMPGLGDVYNGDALHKAEDTARMMEDYMENLSGVLETVRN